MARILKLCPTCGKKAEEKSHEVSKFMGTRIVTLTCGHSYTEKLLAKKNWEEFHAQKGIPYTLRPFQGRGYEFARESGFRCLIADQPGLGKTIQALVSLYFHPELLPALIVCKAAVKFQIGRAAVNWLGREFTPEVIETSDDRPSGFAPITIVTYDILNRIQKKEIEKVEKAEAECRKRLGLLQFDPIPKEEQDKLPVLKNPFATYGFKSLALDEVQQIKNPTSKRAVQVMAIAKDIPHVIALSGTPIKNHAGEYFPILHILRPEMFPNYKRFVENECDYYWTGRGYKIGGLRNSDSFFEKTKDFIIRRTREEVMPELPAIDRKFIDCDFHSKGIRDAYGRAQEEFEEAYDSDDNSFEGVTNLLAKMSKLRHLSGLNKVPACVDWTEDFLLDTDPTKKVVIFVHHKDVGNMLENSLNNVLNRLRTEGIDIAPCSVYTADLNSEQRTKVVQDFIKDANKRVLVASTKAMGEGVDGLQHVCSDYIMLERQWTPTDEEQAEGRFSRFGAEGKESISGNYFITVGSIDEYFTEIVEKKRSILAQTMDNKDYIWDETSLMKELAEALATKGRKGWKLK